MSANGDRVWYATAHRELAADTDSARRHLRACAATGRCRQISSRAPVSARCAVGRRLRRRRPRPVLHRREGRRHRRQRHRPRPVRPPRRRHGAAVTPGTALGDRHASPATSTSSAPTARTLTFFTNESLVAADADTLTTPTASRPAGGAYKLVTPGPSESTSRLREPRRHAHVVHDEGEGSSPPTTTRPPISTSGAPTARIRLISGGTANIAGDADRRPRGRLQRALHDDREAAAGDGDVTGVDIYERRGDGSLRLVTGGTRRRHPVPRRERRRLRRLPVRRQARAGATPTASATSTCAGATARCCSLTPGDAGRGDPDSRRAAADPERQGRTVLDIADRSRAPATRTS